MVELFNAFRDYLYHVLTFFQHLVEPVLGSQSYWFSIVMLTLAVRIVLIPLTVKQVRSTRAMAELQPELKKLQAKYKNDRQKLNEEMMALYRERGFNPMAGCWPLLAQMPFFFALYRVIYSQNIAGGPNILRGATFFGIPLSDRWSTLPTWADKLASPQGLTILALILAMSATTYISQRQLMAKQGSQVNPQQQMLMRILPLTFLIFAVNVPLAIIIYWVTTNLWSMGQQYFLLKNAPVPAGGAAPVPAPAVVDSGEKKGLGVFSLFRGLTQQHSPDRDEPSTNGSGSSRPKTVDGKATAKAPPKSARTAKAPPKAGGPAKRTPASRDTRPAEATGTQQARAIPKANGVPQADGTPKGDGTPRKGGQAKPNQPGQSGAPGGRKPAPGSRKGKPSGQQRRSKR
jgi:YidC/Oxa1 family membrane protein insertase